MEKRYIIQKVHYVNNIKYYTDVTVSDNKSYIVNICRILRNKNLDHIYRIVVLF